MAAAGCRTRCCPLLTQLLLQLLLLAALWTPTPRGGARALRLVRVRVPPLVARGMTARLECRFELQRDRLYSVTWYKDHEEFYRYVPRAPTPQHSYRLEGVRVVDELSDSQQVILRSVSLRATGVYRCEVSAEAPSFTSVHGEGHMQVVSLPHEGPEISGEVGGVFRQGDVLALNCTSGRSSPPARIRWFVNDRQVPPALEASVQQHGLTATVSGLRLVVSERHFSADGRLRVRCQATVTAGGGPDAEPLVETREALVVACPYNPPRSYPEPAVAGRSKCVTVTSSQCPGRHIGTLRAGTSKAASVCIFPVIRKRFESYQLRAGVHSVAKAQGSAGCARPPPLQAVLLTSLLVASLLVRSVSSACA